MKKIFVLVFIMFACSLFAEQAKTAEDLFELGVERTENSDYKGAIKYFDMAIKIKPDDIWSIGAKGHAEMMLKEYKSALRDLNRAVELDPKDETDVIDDLAACKKKMGDYKGAIADYEKSLRINGENLNRVMNTGHCYALMADYRSALKYYDKAWWINPGAYVGFRYRGITKYYLGDKAGAIKELKRSRVPWEEDIKKIEQGMKPDPWKE